MLSRIQAQFYLTSTLPDLTVKAWTKYKNFYVFRVEHPDPAEKDFDPFYSVDNVSGEVRDFSVLTDGNSPEFDKLTWIGV